MEDEKILTISMNTASCAVRHIVAAHESAVTEKPVDFCGLCFDGYHMATCDAPCKLPEHSALEWYEMLAPLFDATGIHPRLCRDDGPDLEDCSPDQS